MHMPTENALVRKIAHGMGLAVIALFVWIAVEPAVQAADTAEAGLKAGVAKIDVTHPDVPLATNPLWVKALVIRNGSNTAVLITVDAVAIGEIGPIRNDYLGTVRTALQKELKIDPQHVLVNASHCHGTVCNDVADRTIAAVKQAYHNLVPVQAGIGVGHEDRVMENRRLFLKNGKEIDIRHAYSMPPDEEVAGVGPVDPQIGILRLDTPQGQPVAVVYNFACHPIKGVPDGTNTADLTGFASQVIEDNLGNDAIALFVQGCAGDINPAKYKDVYNPHNSQELGNLLGLSALTAIRKIKCQPTTELKVINETLALPRADLQERIAEMALEKESLLRSLGGTTLNFKTFVPLFVRYNLFEEYPSYYSQYYRHEEMLGRNDLQKLDAENRRNLDAYLRNVRTMEELTRNQINTRLLEKHQAQNIAAGSRTVDVEIVGLRVGNFVLVTFPGGLTVQIGLNIKQASPHQPTFVAGYTNGYIYYAPTTKQLQNVGGAQEDSDCILAPEWQPIFENKVAEILKRL